MAKSHAGKRKNLFVFTSGLSRHVHEFLENFSVLLSAGMDVLSALAAVEEEITSRRMKRFVKEIRVKIENGSTLWEAMDESYIFGSSIISLVRLGEESGRLSQNLETVVEQQDKEWMFRTKIRTAMLYPSIVLPLTFFVGIGVAWFALPKLADVFSELNAQLPPITRALMAMGRFFSSYGAVFVPIIFAAFLIVTYFLFSFPKTRFVGQIVISSLPVFRRLIREVELARVGYVLSGLLKSGIPVTEAIKSLRESTNFYAYRKYYNSLYQSIEQGNSFKKSFSLNKNTNKLIPTSVQQMIISGEESGRLTTILERIGKSYEARVEVSIKNISTVIEPVMLIIIGLAVATIALGIFMPIYDLANII
jgi:type IV pilus assembly protein PilC